jgi:hypothetical protein
MVFPASSDARTANVGSVNGAWKMPAGPDLQQERISQLKEIPSYPNAEPSETFFPPLSNHRRGAGMCAFLPKGIRSANRNR